MPIAVRRGRSEVGADGYLFIMSTPAGWYSDPSNTSLQRYWDGERWTEHTHAAPAAAPAQQQPYYGGEVGASDAGGALAAAIVGLIICGPVSIYAFIKGRDAKAEAARTNRSVAGQMNAAYIISIISLSLWALFLVIFLLAAIAGAA